MKLVTYRNADGRQVPGIVDGDSIRDLSPAGSSLLDIIASGAADSSHASSDTVALDSVTLLAPIPRPASNIICLGRNYAEHAEESARARNEQVDKPTFFTKAVTSVIGPGDEIPYDPTISRELDWEVELAVVISRRARRVSREDALQYVFGYTVLNDVSARDVQYGYGGQFFFGKSLDGLCPIGPWIVTADEIPDPQNLSIRLRVNGQTKQDANTRDMIYGVAETIEILSRGMTLEAGQIIATGTPAGVGFARDPREFLQPGDAVEAEIDGIGTLRNRVGSSTA